MDSRNNDKLHHDKLFQALIVLLIIIVICDGCNVMNYLNQISFIELNPDNLSTIFGSFLMVCATFLFSQKINNQNLISQKQQFLAEQERLFAVEDKNLILQLIAHEQIDNINIYLFNAEKYIIELEQVMVKADSRQRLLTLYRDLEVIKSFLKSQELKQKFSWEMTFQAEVLKTKRAEELKLILEQIITRINNPDNIHLN